MLDSQIASGGVGIRTDDVDDDSSRTTGSGRKKRSSYWDRPKQRRDFHWFLGRLGSTLIVAGLLVFLFVGYQLWGTGIEAAQSQQRLGDSFAELSSSDIATPTPVTISAGDAIAVIEIPAIGVNKYVVAGVETADLKKGPGHYPNTPMPGQLGNAAIAGHRTTYGEPFRQLDELAGGDEIIVTDLFGRRFIYLVTETKIVTPDDSWVVSTINPDIATLTLTTCNPEFSARQRLIVFAALDTTRSQVAEYPASVYADRVETGTGESSNTIDSQTEASQLGDDVFDKGWFSDPSAIPQVAAWSLLEITIVILAWAIARKLRNRAIGAALGFVPFFVVLYFVFQNVNRLLPPNL